MNNKILDIDDFSHLQFLWQAKKDCMIDINYIDKDIQLLELNKKLLETQIQLSNIKLSQLKIEKKTHIENNIKAENNISDFVDSLEKKYDCKIKGQSIDHITREIKDIKDIKDINN